MKSPLKLLRPPVSFAPVADMSDAELEDYVRGVACAPSFLSPPQNSHVESARQVSAELDAFHEAQWAEKCKDL